MANTINQVDVLTRLHNLMGHRVSPGGTDEDLKRYIQDGFDYCWRYYKWRFSLKNFTTLADGVLPTDFDLIGYYSLADSAPVVWDFDLGKIRFEDPQALEGVYQVTPPTLDASTAVPFPSARVVALSALVYAKMAENPTRADVQQEWDLLHSELDRLVGVADVATPRSPRNRHDVTGTNTGQV